MFFPVLFYGNLIVNSIFRLQKVCYNVKEFLFLKETAEYHSLFREISMTENEFLQILNEQLTGQMSASAAASHIEYYRNYIHDEIRKGRKEEDVLKNLGDPRLMARTILDTTPKSLIRKAEILPA